MPRLKKSIKDPIVDLKNKINKAKLEKKNLLRAHEDEENSLLYQFCKHKKNKNSANKNGYLAYNKLKRLNTKIRKISGKLKHNHSITVGTDHPQCAEPPPIPS